MKVISLLFLFALSFSITDKELFEYLKSQGKYTEYGAAGLMGNLFAESGLQPANLEDRCNYNLGLSDAEYTRRCDNGAYTDFITDYCGYGYAQWTFWSRKELLWNYKKSQGTSIGDAKMQLRFLINELASDFRTVSNTLMSATSVRQASDVVLTQFEQPADQSESVKQLRASYGQKYYDLYHSGGGDIEYYTVQPGDTLSSIAIMFGTTVAKLCEWNHITNPDYIEVGQVLIVRMKE